MLEQIFRNSIFILMKDQLKKNKQTNILIRLTIEEKKMIQHFAKSEGSSTTDYLLSLGLKKVIISNRIEYLNDLRNYNFEISKIGNNINQLAKHVNQARKLKTIDSGSINVFEILMKEYLKNLAQANLFLKKVYSCFSKSI